MIQILPIPRILVDHITFNIVVIHIIIFCFSTIVLKMIQIREEAYGNAIQRFERDYVWYTGPEQPTQFWPWRIYRYPKRYAVGNVADKDGCSKDYNICKDFAHGIFHGGCHHGYTYGGELMIGKLYQFDFYI